MTIYMRHVGQTGPAVSDEQLLSDTEAVARANDITLLNRSMNAELGEGFFDNPVQMMLLELFIARIQRRRTTVKMLALSSGVPASTAQRWIDRMEAQKQVVKLPNRGDRRSLFVAIEDGAFLQVRRLLARMGEGYRRSCSPD